MRENAVNNERVKERKFAKRKGRKKASEKAKQKVS